MQKRSFKSKPWELGASDIPSEIYFPRGMLGDEERRCLWWLGNHVFRGDGLIVDAGAFAGASAFCLASGASTHNRRGKIVHSYDLFYALDQYVADAITADFRPIGLNGSYRDVFDFQTGKYSGLIEAHGGDFLTHAWAGEPIEILFIDIAKTRELNSHTVREFFPRLIPGHSIVIQQDFYHCWHPYIHLTMQYLKDYFEIIDSHVLWQSRVYRLVKPLNDDLKRIVDYDFSFHERFDLLSEFEAGESGDMQRMAAVVRLWDVVMTKNFDLFDRELARFRRLYPIDKQALWETQINEIIDLVQTWRR
jgi:hypothetical protein